MAFNRSSANGQRKNANTTLDIACNTLAYIFAQMGLVWGFPCQAVFGDTGSIIDGGRALSNPCILIAAVAAGWLNLRESIEVEIDDRLKRRRGGAVAEAIG